MSQARSDTGTLRAYSVRLVSACQTALWRTRARCRPLTETLLIGLPEHLATRRLHKMKATAGQTLDRLVGVGNATVRHRIIRDPTLNRSRRVRTPVEKGRLAKRIVIRSLRRRSREALAGWQDRVLSRS
jgi:hypothetical protein